MMMKARATRMREAGVAACLLTLAWLAATASAAGKPDAKTGEIDFNRQIRPILSENCFTCHGPDEAKRKAGLRLDQKEEAFKKLKSGDTAIVPGDPAKSSLVARIITQDEDEVMPPPKTGKKLSADQVELLKRWIAQGANWKIHWSYIKPERPALPPVSSKKWPRNEIDRFILARLDQEKLKPAPEAAKETLIRRASLDLTGLPPSVAEVESFLADKRSDAYERLVDRLLASPQYGERWARPWLDQARYADSNGYEKDDRRTMWPYRDWVIHALNQDMAFDQFTVEQLAGDLLPNATREQKIATGFHRNTMVNTEGGTDDEEFRTAAIVDRVNTTFDVWMGTTMGCAQCHTHKYDPFTQTEYYQIFAFFNQTKDKGRVNDPQLELPSPEQAAKRAEIKAKIEPLEKRLNTQTPELDGAQAKWAAPLRQAYEVTAKDWQILTPIKATASEGVTLQIEPDQSVYSTGKAAETSTYELELPAPEATVTALRLEALLDDRLPNKSSGRSEDGDFVLTEFTVDVATGGQKLTNGFETAYADYSMPKYEVKDAVDGNAASGWSIAAHETNNRVNHEAIFLLKQPLAAGKEAKLLITLKQESQRSKHLLGRFRLAYSTAPTNAFQTWAKLPANVRKVIAAEKQTEAQKKELAGYYRSIDSGLNTVRTEIAELRKQEPKNIPTTLVMEAMDKPRTNNILIRGSHLNPGAQVQPGVPSVLHGLPAGAEATRLTLARWLVSPENPLVGRVTMNRLWSQYFGRGLVETSEEFGAQGEAPTHPQLLDWLATEFVRQKWSLKAMHRLIATSAAYRQSSQVSSTALQRDPFNRLISRGPRFRMEAEMVRDNALAVSGLLSAKLGGPSVFPYQPDGIWNSPYSGDKWVMSKDGDQYRRGLYTFWRRTAPYAAFMAFDAPSREVACERRPRSNTPVQALVTLNDPAYLASAAALAKRIVTEGGATEKKQLAFAFKAVLARQPSSKEASALLELFRDSLKKYLANPAAAKAMARIEGPKDGETVDQAELAAWTVISNVLLNLDEALTKG
jgi:mono/diheme cytochrome c family protein